MEKPERSQKVKGAKKTKFGQLPVKDIMNKRFRKVHINDRIPKVCRQVFRCESNVLPVFGGGKFIGEIHEIDLLKLAIEPKDIPEEELIPLGFGIDMGFFAKTARDIVRRHEITVKPDTKIKDAAFMMFKEGVRSIPVIENGKLLGILTERDILKKILKRGLKR